MSKRRQRHVLRLGGLDLIDHGQIFLQSCHVFVEMLADVICKALAERDMIEAGSSPLTSMKGAELEVCKHFVGETQRFIVKDCENLILYTVIPTVTTSTKIVFVCFSPLSSHSKDPRCKSSADQL